MDFKNVLNIYKHEGMKGLVTHYNYHIPVTKKIQYGLMNKVAANKTPIYKVLDFKMHLNLEDTGLSRQLYFYRKREFECTNILMNLLQKDMVGVDIGSNIGYYPIIEGKRITKLYCFEPVRENYDLLVKNINLNNLDNVESYNKAVSYTSGEYLNINVTDKRNRSTMLNDTSSINSEMVETVCIDDFDFFDKIDFIRMDIEGYEAFVIPYMLKTLNTMQDGLLFIEYHPYLMLKSGLNYTEPLKLVFDMGFVPLYVVKEYGALKEVSYKYSHGVDYFWAYLDSLKMTPPVYTCGMGLFLGKGKYGNIN